MRTPINQIYLSSTMEYHKGFEHRSLCFQLRSLALQVSSSSSSSCCRCHSCATGGGSGGHGGGACCLCWLYL